MRQAYTSAHRRCGGASMQQSGMKTVEYGRRRAVPIRARASEFVLCEQVEGAAEEKKRKKAQAVEREMLGRLCELGRERG